MQLDELYFGIKLPPLSWKNRAEWERLETYNLFDCSRIKQSIAIYKTMGDEQRRELSSPLNFCFGDVWGRCEYEMVICPWPIGNDETVSECGIKVDLFEMYVKPNKDYLMKLVDSVDEKDCKRYLKELRKLYRRK